MAHETILIVDDELMVRRLLSDALQRAGYTIELAASGAAAIERLARPGVDLLLLDLQLGDIDGVEVMSEARQLWPELPIVMLTAHGSLPSAIAAVRYGASDYLLKPIGIEALRERIAAVLSARRSARGREDQLRAVFLQLHELLRGDGPVAPERATQLAAAPDAYAEGPLRMDIRRHQVTMHGQPVDATPAEFAILAALLEHPGAVVSCSQLARALSTAVDDEEEARQLIRPHIVRLRRKIEPDAQQPRYLLSVRGIGYRWCVAAAG